MMNWYGDSMSGWGYTLMTVSFLAFWGLVIIGVILLVRSGRTARSPLESHSPERLLSERFARGEIDEDEYGSRIAVLRGSVRL